MSLSRTTANALQILESRDTQCGIWSLERLVPSAHQGHQAHSFFRLKIDAKIASRQTEVVEKPGDKETLRGFFGRKQYALPSSDAE